MHSSEHHVLPESDFYVYEPSALARDVYLYPLSTGHFIYSSGYRNSRRSFDSFELFYVESGSAEMTNHGKTFTANAGQFVLLDCYSPHSYYSADGWACYWLHFDGQIARAFYRQIQMRYDSFIYSIDQFSPAFQNLMNVYELFRLARPVDESRISGMITSILNTIIASAPDIQKDVPAHEAIAGCIAYISEHFRYPITLKDLSDQASISPYYFSRVFRRETGSTPHQYVVNTRLSAAKYLLRTTSQSIKDIAIATGWGSESSFCSSFLKNVGMQPSQYRTHGLYDGQTET